MTDVTIPSDDESTTTTGAAVADLIAKVDKAAWDIEELFGSKGSSVVAAESALTEAERQVIQARPTDVMGMRLQLGFILDRADLDDHFEVPLRHIERQLAGMALSIPSLALDLDAAWEGFELAEDEDEKDRWHKEGRELSPQLFVQRPTGITDMALQLRAWSRDLEACSELYPMVPGRVAEQLERMAREQGEGAAFEHLAP